MQLLAAAAAEDLVEAMADSAVAMHTRHQRVDTAAAGARLTAAAGPIREVARITGAEDTTAAVAIMVPVSDSASAFIPATDMPLRSATLPDSIMHTACGNIIRAALCRTDIKPQRVGRAILRPTLKTFRG